MFGPMNYDRRIVTLPTDKTWGTDATTAHSRLNERATIFVAVDHCTGTPCLIGSKASQRVPGLEACRPTHQR